MTIPVRVHHALVRVLPEAGIAHVRKIAERKGIGYQTLLEMHVREGLQRESQGVRLPVEVS